MSERLGIFGGTFDPIHIGHLIVAEVARQILALHRVLFIPAHIPPHKGATPTPSEHRFRMVSLACAGNPFFEVSDVEIRREGPSYTVDTLRELRKRLRPDAEFFLMIGADSARDFGSWKDHETLLSDTNVVVLGRPGAQEDSISPGLGERLTYLSTPLLELSSTDIRQRVHSGGSIRYMVTDSVENYIRAESLYGSGKDFL